MAGRAAGGNAASFETQRLLWFRWPTRAAQLRWRAGRANGEGSELICVRVMAGASCACTAGTVQKADKRERRAEKCTA